MAQHKYRKMLASFGYKHNANGCKLTSRQTRYLHIRRFFYDELIITRHDGKPATFKFELHKAAKLNDLSQPYGVDQEMKYMLRVREIVQEKLAKALESVNEEKMR